MKTEIGFIGFPVSFWSLFRAIEKEFSCKTFDVSCKHDVLPQALCGPVVFVCAVNGTDPETWKQETGELDLYIEMIADHGYDGIVCISSDVLPGTIGKLSSQYPDLRIVHNPIFVDHTCDFSKQVRVLASGSEEDLKELYTYYSTLAPNAAMVTSNDWLDTETAKYFHNCYIAVTTSFCNEMKDVCARLGIKYDYVRDITTMQGALSYTHSMLPYNDGGYGFGWPLAKDSTAFLYWAEMNGVFMHTLGGATMTNRYKRPTLYNWVFDENRRKEKAHQGQGASGVDQKTPVSGMRGGAVGADIPNGV